VLSQEMHFLPDLEPILRYRKTNSVKFFLVFVLHKMNAFAAYAHDLFVIYNTVYLNVHFNRKS
jgi:hypothetical protein